MKTPSRSRSRRASAFVARLVVGLLVAAAAVTVVPSSAQAADESISVNFSSTSGAPTYRASGWIYGMTENASGPADHFYRDVKFQYMRAGGAQLPGVAGSAAPTTVAGTPHSPRRVAPPPSAEVHHPAARPLGADGAGISRFPGDNGNWTDYDNFLTRLISDVRASGLSVQWDIWNEPNITIFWNRPISQYLELWRRTYQRIRTEFPASSSSGRAAPAYRRPTTPSGTSTWTSSARRTRCRTSSAGTRCPVTRWPTSPPPTPPSTHGHRPPASVPDQRVRLARRAEPADGAWYIARLERARPTACGRTGPVAAACTTTRQPVDPQLGRPAPTQG
ncbi:hypothetical protein NKG94_21850 [Micromonospora sp. M12]